MGKTEGSAAEAVAPLQGQLLTLKNKRGSAVSVGKPDLKRIWGGCEGTADGLNCSDVWLIGLGFLLFVVPWDH